jgi:hypothetical protein
MLRDNLTVDSFRILPLHRLERDPPQAHSQLRLELFLRQVARRR